MLCCPRAKLWARSPALKFQREFVSFWVWLFFFCFFFFFLYNNQLRQTPLGRWLHTSEGSCHQHWPPGEGGGSAPDAWLVLGSGQDPTRTVAALTTGMHFPRMARRFLLSSPLSPVAHRQQHRCQPRCEPASLQVATVNWPKCRPRPAWSVFASSSENWPQMSKNRFSMPSLGYRMGLQ